MHPVQLEANCLRNNAVEEMDYQLSGAFVSGLRCCGDRYRVIKRGWPATNAPPNHPWSRSSSPVLKWPKWSTGVNDSKARGETKQRFYWPMRERVQNNVLAEHKNSRHLLEGCIPWLSAGLFSDRQSPAQG